MTAGEIRSAVRRLVWWFGISFLVLAVSPVSAQQAQIASGAITNGLTQPLYAFPDLTSVPVAWLPPFTILDVQSYTRDGGWYYVSTSGGAQGWLAFIDLEIVQLDTSVPVIDVPPDDVLDGYLLWGVSPRVYEIYVQGRERGNRAFMFAKVGDSISANKSAYLPYKPYILGDYPYLSRALTFFGYDHDEPFDNPFKHRSRAAAVGWTSYDLLTPPDPPDKYCYYGETPLACEYRLVAPSIALIMIGTNDVNYIEPEVYRRNLSLIAAYSIEQGVIPVLSTIPPQHDRDAGVAQFNQIIVETAQLYGVPLWNYWRALRDLPGRGLNDDGVHPSLPYRGLDGATDFSPENLWAGYPVRNLTGLQVLDALMQVMMWKG